jgi:hypothetical protein
MGTMKKRFLILPFIVFLISSLLAIPLLQVSSQVTVSAYPQHHLFSHSSLIKNHLFSLFHQQQPSDDYIFSPQEITLQDDAFHGEKM